MFPDGMGVARCATVLRVAHNASAVISSLTRRGNVHSTSAPTAAPVPMRVGVLHYTYVPDMVTRRSPFRAGHLALARKMTEQGHLVMGGAYDNPVDGGLLVFTSAEAAARFAELDPYVLNGLVTRHSVRTCNVVAGTLYKNATPSS